MPHRATLRLETWDLGLLGAIAGHFLMDIYLPLMKWDELACPDIYQNRKRITISKSNVLRLAAFRAVRFTLPGRHSSCFSARLSLALFGLKGFSVRQALPHWRGQSRYDIEHLPSLLLYLRVNLQLAEARLRRYRENPSCDVPVQQKESGWRNANRLEKGKN